MSKRKDNIGLLGKYLHRALRDIYRKGKISKMDYKIDYSEAMHQVTLMMVHFNLSYKEMPGPEKMDELRRTQAHFEAAKILLEMMIEENVLTEKNGAISVMERLADIEENIGKWRAAERKKARLHAINIGQTEDTDNACSSTRLYQGGAPAGGHNDAPAED